MKCGYMTQVKQGTREMWVPCRQCQPCRINHRRMWTGRILLEAQHSQRPSTFLTLTYDESNLPDRGSVVPGDVAGFINRLRNRREITSRGNLRFFAVGEYGSKTWRPHYHLSLFNVEPELEKVMQDCWNAGHIMAGDITPESSAYIAGYVNKKMNQVDDIRLTDTGLYPEFARMSRYPPLGAQGMQNILDILMTRQGAIAIADHGDVPSSYATHGRTWPIGKYWRTWLRNQIGITKPPVYEPWKLDPDQFHEELKNAEKQAVKSFKQYRTHNRTI